MNRKILLIIAVLASGALSAHAQQNLVVNPGFETANFTGWTTAGACRCTVDGDPHSGNYAARLGSLSVRYYGDLSQNVPTVVGQMYNVQFWLAHSGDPIPEPAGDFGASFSGVTFVNLVNYRSAFPYTLFQANIRATSTASTLRFFFQEQCCSWHLDDVVVTRVPVP